MDKEFLNGWQQRQAEREPLLYYIKVMRKKDGSLFGFLADISQTGLMLLRETAVNEHHKFDLYIDLEAEFGLDGRLAFEAQCVWCKPDVNPDYHVVGFKFTSLESHDTDTINYIIDKFGFNQKIF